MTRAPHVCCLCHKRHPAGSKAYTADGTRCAKNCTRKPPPVSRPFPWVGKGACYVCGSATPRGQRKCKNREKCTIRALGSMTAISRDDRWILDEYDAAMSAGRDELAVAA